MKILQKLSSEGKAVVCTVHQPSSEVFELFDRILLLEKGRVAYMGPRDRMLDFFRSLGYSPLDNCNPVEFYFSSVPALEKESICNSYEKSEFRRSIQEQVETNYSLSTNSNMNSSTLKLNRSPYKVNWWCQFSAVTKRRWWVTKRNLAFLGILTFQIVSVLDASLSAQL